MMDWEGHAPAAYWGWGMIVILAAMTVLGVVLTALVLRKAGRSPLWSLLFLFPLAYVIGLWVFAFTRWPNEEPGPETLAETLGGHPIPGRSDDEPPLAPRYR